MRPIFCVYLLILLSITLFSQEAVTIIVGAKASADGSVLLAHSQGWIKKDTFVNIRKKNFDLISNRDESTESEQGLLSGGRDLNPYIWIEAEGNKFTESYVNQYGVTVVINLCKSREDKGEIHQGGVGAGLAKTVVEKARSAIQGVDIAQNLISQFGFNESGCTLAIADSSEGWVMQIIKGKHWLAQRVPDNQVAVICNRFIVRKVDLKDHQNVKADPDLINYAEKRGWYNKKDSFDFTITFADKTDYMLIDNRVRHWRAVSLLAKEKVLIDSDLPFAFKARRQLRKIDLFRIFRDHYEESEFDPAVMAKKEKSAQTFPLALCSPNICYSLVAHLRPDEAKEISSVVWICFSRPDVNTFSPWYPSILSIPNCYAADENRSNMKTACSKNEIPSQAGYAYCSYWQLSQKVNISKKEYYRSVVKEWENFEDFLMKNERNREKEFGYVLKTNRLIALNIITNYVHYIEYRKWFLTCEMIAGFNEK